jgi:hypothetical protein
LSVWLPAKKRRYGRCLWNLSMSGGAGLLPTFGEAEPVADYSGFKVGDLI